MNFTRYVQYHRWLVGIARSTCRIGFSFLPNRGNSYVGTSLLPLFQVLFAPKRRQVVRSNYTYGTPSTGAHCNNNVRRIWSGSVIGDDGKLQHGTQQRSQIQKVFSNSIGCDSRFLSLSPPRLCARVLITRTTEPLASFFIFYYIAPIRSQTTYCNKQGRVTKRVKDRVQY